jgi:CrcB protein
MTRLLIVAAGGALGAAARYGVGRFLPAGTWPWATLGVNVTGGLLMGLLTGWLASRQAAGDETLRLFLAVGVLGGFTTFSAFSLEAVALLERRQYSLACGYVLASVSLSILALFLGLLIARRFFGADL